LDNHHNFLWLGGGGLLNDNVGIEGYTAPNYRITVEMANLKGFA
jgi:hypothetical protein